MSTSLPADESNISYPNVTKKFLLQIQMNRFEIFKAQDLENGHFDVIFEIDGKILHANKFILTPASETMNSWLSDRWSNKDKPIKIESYTYDIFYQFLCFLYSGSCFLSNENVFQLVDIAEFYAVTYLKKFCDKFLSNMKKMTVEKIQELYEFAVRYSLPEFLDSIKDFVRYGKNEMFKDEKFCEYKKSFVEFLSTFDRIPNYTITYEHPYGTQPQKESDFFESIYKWAEHQVMKQKSVDENFDLQEAIKIELEPILPNIKFSQMNLKFLMNFVLENGFILSPKELGEFFKRFRVQIHRAKEEDFMQWIYELAEKQALTKQAMSPDGENFNLTVSIKADLAEVLPHVEFYKMDESFLNDFVVVNGIITEAEARHVYDLRVEINNNGKSIYGVFKDIIGLRQILVIRLCSSFWCGSSFTRIYFDNLRIPSIPSTVTKMKGIDWYLCLEDDGSLTLKHYSRIDRSDYLLAEMKSDTEFKLNPNEVTYLSKTND